MYSSFSLPLSFCYVLALLTFFSLTSVAAKPQTNYTLRYVPLTEYGVNNLWGQVDQKFQDFNITSIFIQQNVIELEGLRKLFSQDLTSLTSIGIIDVIVNQPIMQCLMSQDKIYELEQFVMKNNNAKDEDFANIKPRQAKWKSFGISDNDIGVKGFKGLARLKMPYLNRLDVEGTSLIEDEAVDAVISFGLSNIQALSIINTGISGENFLRILKAIDTDKLKILLMGINKFSPQFFREFSKLSFNSLTNLNLAQLQINEDGFQYLKNMKFPSLLSFNVQVNQLTNEMGKQLINKRNMPQLERLILDKNFINSTFLQHLKQEGYVFKILSCVIDKMDLDGLKQIANMNLTNLEELQYRARTTNSTYALDFLKSINPKVAKKFFIEGHNKNDDFLPLIFNQKWEQLKVLELDQVKEFNFQQIEDVIFPSLTTISLSFRMWTDQDHLIYIVKNLQRIAPQLREIKFDLYNAQGLLTSFFDGQLAHSMTKQLRISIQNQLPLEGQYQFVLDPVQKPKILTLTVGDGFYNYMLSKLTRLDLSSLQLDLSALGLDFLNIDQFINEYQNNLHKNFNMSHLQTLIETTKLDFIRQIIKDTERKCVLPRLRTLIIPVQGQTDLQMLKYCSLPSLNNFAIVNQGQNREGSDQISFKFVQNKFPHIQVLFLRASLDKENLKEFFKKNPFKKLLGIQLGEIINMLPQDLAQIQASIPYFHRVRAIDYSHAFINKDLTFLTKTEAQPNILKLSNVLFGPGVLAQLCDMNFQFLQDLVMSSSGIDDTSLIQLLECLQKKYPNRKVHFPKLKNINLVKNYIGTSGFSKLMKMGVPQLHSIQFEENRDYEIFNTIFSSPYSSHLSECRIEMEKFYGIDPSLDPRNMRRLKELIIQSSSLMETDIEALSKFQFYSIITITLTVKKIQNCKFLEYLLHLSKNAIDVQIAVENSPLLNSTCLKDNQQDFSQVTPQILVIASSEYLGEMNYFTQRMLNKNSVLEQLVIVNTPVPHERLMEMVQTSDLTNLVQVTFVNCPLKDEFVKALFEKDLPNLVKISFIGTNLTAQAFSTFKDKNLTKLNELSLQKNRLGDKAIYYLTRNNILDNMYSLSLANTDITREGLLSLNKLKARKLIMLDLSCNDLSYQDLSYFSTKNFVILLQVTVYPELKQSQVQKLEQMYKQKNVIQAHIPGKVIHVITNAIEDIEYSLSEDVYYDQDQNDELIK